MRNETAAAGVYMRERADPVVLQLEDKVVVIERLVHDEHGHGAKRSDAPSGEDISAAIIAQSRINMRTEGN